MTFPYRGVEDVCGVGGGGAGRGGGRGSGLWFMTGIFPRYLYLFAFCLECILKDFLKLRSLSYK